MIYHLFRHFKFDKFPTVGVGGSLKSEISCFFWGRDPGTLKSDIVSLLGYETLKLNIRRLKLWKPRDDFSSLQTLSI